jgi:hypothetical protein
MVGCLIDEDKTGTRAATKDGALNLTINVCNGLPWLRAPLATVDHAHMVDQGGGGREGEAEGLAQGQAWMGWEWSGQRC